MLCILVFISCILLQFFYCYYVLFFVLLCLHVWFPYMIMSFDATIVHIHYTYCCFIWTITPLYDDVTDLVMSSGKYLPGESSDHLSMSMLFRFNPGSLLNLYWLFIMSLFIEIDKINFICNTLFKTCQPWYAHFTCCSVLCKQLFTKNAAAFCYNVLGVVISSL